MTNLKKTVKRLIIIVLSLFFLLIIRASIWRPYGKNLDESLIPVTTKKMTNLQSTVTRFFVFTELFGAFYQTDILNSYFKILVESHYEGNDDQFSNTVKRRGIIVFRKYSAADYQCDILELLL